MKAKETAVSTGGPVDSHTTSDKLVNVKVNGKLYHVPSGTYLVATFKTMVEVPPQDNLERLVNGEVKPLDDAGKVEVRGDESFVSFPCSGGAS